MEADDMAFPCSVELDFTGLTKREYVAAMAMQGLLANPKLAELDELNIAYRAVRYADTLVMELAK